MLENHVALVLLQEILFAQLIFVLQGMGRFGKFLLMEL
jgi:hypothetical protein